LGLISNLLGFRYLTPDLITGFYPISGLFNLTVNKDFVADNQIGSQRSGTIREVCSDDGIEASALVGFIGKDRKGAVNGHGAED
jgi:hypothetical protein